MKSPFDSETTSPDGSQAINKNQVPDSEQEATNKVGDNTATKIKTFSQCALAGLCIAGSLPPWGWWPLAFIGFAIVDQLIKNQPTKSRFLRTWLIGMFWLYPATLWMWDMTAPGYIATGAIFGFYFAVAAALTPGDSRRKVVLPGAIAAAEAIRWTWPFGGVPLANIALSQVNSPLLHASRIAGSLFVIVLVVVIGQLLSSIYDSSIYDTIKTHSRNSVSEIWPNLINKTIIIPVALVIIAVTAGYLHPRSSVEKEIKVALVQGGGPQNTRASLTSSREVLDRHIEASKFIKDPVDLIIWPENVINPTTTNERLDYLAFAKNEIAIKHNTTLISGWFHPESPTKNANYQSSIGPNGEELDRYDKIKLVPFGEVVPFRSLAMRFSDQIPLREVQVGTRDPILDTPVGPVGVSISWEGYFDTRARAAVKDGAEILTNPTNGASYWLTQVQTQQVAANQLHAAENDRWVLQVAPTGLSAIINPDGKVEQRSNVSEMIVLEQSVEMRQGRTLASRVGFLPVLLYAAITILWGLRKQNKTH